FDLIIITSTTTKIETLSLHDALPILLGDRVRMQAYAGDRDVFIRSMAARGHAGGLSSATGAAAAVLDAAGFDLILIETVGTGQRDRKSTRLNSSHVSISYAVFCLKKK